MVATARREPATGMAFLVNGSGLLATCAHVLIEIGASFGQRVALFGASPDLPIAVDAEVLREGWRGPFFDVASPYFPNRRDERSDVLREDLAFLRLDLDSVRAHVTPRRESDKDGLINVRTRSAPVSDPRACLLDAARVLPLGPPGYREKGRILRGWTVIWEFGAPYLQHADALFEGVERGLHQSVRIRSDLITHGFSGCPLWDEERRLAVGMVREGLPAMPGQVVATDVRAFTEHPEVRLSYDTALTHMLDLMSNEIDYISPRHAELVGWWADPSIFVEPELALATPIDPLTTEKLQGSPAISTLLAHMEKEERIIVQGLAGTGKTTLFARLARYVVENGVHLGGRRLVPLLVSATELVGHDLDLLKFLETARTRYAGSLMEVRALADSLEQNDAQLLLLIDALDEIDTRSQQVLSTRLARRNRSKTAVDGLIARVVFSTRPSELTRIEANSRTPIGHMVLDLRPLDRLRTEQLVIALFSSSEERAAFLRSLRDLRWHDGDTTPLQIRMAAEIVRRGAQLPERPLDLSSRFIDLLIEQGETEAQERLQQRRLVRDEVAKIYLPALRDILGFLGMQTITTTHEISVQSLGEILIRAGEQATQPRWLINIGALLTFMTDELPRRVPILAKRDSGGGDAHLVWMHRTFAETLAAEHAVASKAADRRELSALVGAAIRSRTLGHPYALMLLAAMSRLGRHDAVADALRDCMERPIGGVRPQLLALRALDASIDADGALRATQVRLLLRVLVTEYHESQRCAEIFSNDQLPSPWTIMKRPELRSDIVGAFDDRFRVRRARVGRDRQMKVLKREAKILDELGLWSDFEGIASAYEMGGAIREHRPRGPSSRRPSDTKLHPAMGKTTLMVRRLDGKIDLVDVDAYKFVDRVIDMERATPDRFSGAELVGLAAQFIFDEPKSADETNDDASQASEGT